MAVSDVVLVAANGCVDRVFAGKEIERRDGVVIENNVLG